jgi:hypothetical protein
LLKAAAAGFEGLYQFFKRLINGFFGVTETALEMQQNGVAPPNTAVKISALAAVTNCFFAYRFAAKRHRRSI